MGIPLAIAQRAGYNTDVFPNAQMFYPAAGVMLAYFLTRRPGLPAGSMCSICSARRRLSSAAWV